jgi:DNA processing protein
VPAGALQDWLRLSLIPGLTGANWRRLLEHFESPQAILTSSRAQLASVVEAALAAAIHSPPDAARLDNALAWAAEPDHAIITLDDARYPAPLRETPDPPPLLYAAGRFELLTLPAIAIVGSRNATGQGMRNAESFAASLSGAGLCVVSGLALGIDAAAHRGGMAGSASSIAVVGNGIDIVYPRRNADLHAELLTKGLILSEFPLSTAPLAQNFPRRNRIISGLASGCLVVEAALASGSLISARLAADMGREVFAIPGSIHSPLARGCHSLIKQGAKLVETAEDVLEELGLHVSATRVVPAESKDSQQVHMLLLAMGHDPCDVDTLQSRTSIAIDRLLALLTELELAGRVSLLAGGKYQRID